MSSIYDDPDTPSTAPEDSPCIGCEHAKTCDEPCPEYVEWFDAASCRFNARRSRR